MTGLVSISSTFVVYPYTIDSIFNPTHNDLFFLSQLSAIVEQKVCKLLGLIPLKPRRVKGQFFC